MVKGRAHIAVIPLFDDPYSKALDGPSSTTEVNMVLSSEVIVNQPVNGEVP